MTTISAKVIADSIGEDAPRLTTLQLRFPRFLLAELNTHRVFSRNARSSRAVPIAKMIEEAENDPVIPLHWGAAQAGMQAYEECSALIDQSWRDDCAPRMISRDDAWLQARDAAVNHARAFMKAGYHKQVVNRLIEIFLHVDVLLSSTEWSNFFALRDHHAAEPHIQMLARAIRTAMAESTPRKIGADDWHLPYVDFADYVGDWSQQSADDLAIRMGKISSARCARISYKPFEGEGSAEADIALADKLAESGHWSPFEHVAMPDRLRKGVPGRQWWNDDEHANLKGWRQFRRILEDEKRRAAA